jgi:peptidoglycan/LPS O-acetylase OafA/YrhL
MFCYLLFPFLMFLLAQSPRLAGLVLMAGVCVGLVMVSASGLGTGGDLDVFGNTALSLLRALAGFTTGILLCLFCERYRSRRIGDAAFIGALAFLVFAGLMGMGDLWKFPALVLLVHAASTKGRLTSIMLANRPVYYIGQISYSIYLAHAAFIPAFTSVRQKLEGHVSIEAANTIAFLIYAAVLICVASIAYPIVEVRGKTWMLRALRGKRLGDQGRVSAILAPGADMPPGPK